MGKSRHEKPMMAFSLVIVASPPDPPLRISATFMATKPDAERGERTEIQVKMSEFPSEPQLEWNCRDVACNVFTT
jgi:hypothetical protein